VNLLFELFRGGIIFEITNTKEAEIAEASGAVAVLLGYNNSPVHPDGTRAVLEEIQSNISIPVLASFKPGHFIEAEMLLKMGICGIYSDSRFEKIHTHNNFSQFKEQECPLLADVDNLSNYNERFVPVIREKNIEEIIKKLEKKKKDSFVFVTGPIETVSDIALLKRMGADTIIIPNTVFEFPDKEKYLNKLVQASFYFDNSEKLANILEN